MGRVRIVAPAMSDEAALDLVRDLARDGFHIEAQGPLYGAEEFPAEYESPSVSSDPDSLSPADRKAFFESELSRLEVQRQTEPGRLKELPEQHPAPSGWHIVAMS